VIPTLPLRARNRLAETILSALADAEARGTLEALASGAAPGDWAEPADGADASLLRLRARRAAEALRDRPVIAASTRAAVLEAAALLFDAGLGFEVHELLEPHWARADGDERETLQGLIQIAVGYQHLANGNTRGARALLDEGSARLAGRRLDDLDLEPFRTAVVASAARLPDLPPEAIPCFPRRGGGPNGASSGGHEAA